MEFNTPDGADVDGEGNIFLSIPNFNNDHLLQTGAIDAPAAPAMAKIDANNRVITWYTFTAKDMHPDTGRIGPMDNALGPDGNLYVADNQAFWGQDHKSRLLRINIEKGEPVSVDVVVTGLIVANGLVWKGDTLLMTESALALVGPAADGQVTPPHPSGVYAFPLEELRRGPINLTPYSKSAPDRHLLVEFQSSNRGGGGADGVTVDGAGNVYTSIFEDGVIYKTSLDVDNKPLSTVLFAKDDRIKSADGIFWRRADDTIYVADFLGNAIHALDTQGRVSTVHKNGDTDGADGSLDQPAEVLVRGDDLIVVNMDIAWLTPPGVSVNSKVDRPYTVSAISLK